RAIVPEGGRYLFNQSRAFVEAMSACEGLQEEYVLAAAGSSDPLHRTVMAFTSPSRPLVIAEPGYEAPDRAAKHMGAKVITVPLRKDYAHDVRAMARADANAGLIYVCNPNNPTGTVTRRDDIEYLVAHKPAGCVVLIDEAYFHFAETATASTEFAAAGKDV